MELFCVRLTKALRSYSTGLAVASPLSISNHAYPSRRLAMQSALKIQFNPNSSLLISLSRRLIALFPLTLQGLITLLLAAYALRVYGYGAMDLVVFSLAICALSILIFSLFCSVISGIFIQRRVRAQSNRSRSRQAIRMKPASCFRHLITSPWSNSAGE